MKHLLFWLLMTAMVPAWCESVLEPWTAYFGNHYESAAWASSLRDPGGPGRYGYWLPSARNNARMTAADSGDLQELNRQIARGPVVLNAGGLGSGRDESLVTNFMNDVRRDNAASWKRELAQRVRNVAAVPGASDRIYWQFGNEINGPRMLRNLAQWGGIRNMSGAEAMRQVIPLYVEYFLAPGVEATRAASREAYGDAGRIHIMLGSLANARNPSSIRWFEQLLDYTVKGEHAKSLAGRKVSEIVDTLSIHYLVSAQDDGWSGIMDGLSEKWLGRGSIRRIWSTEELGVRRAQAGLGASTALRVTARYLNWWQLHGWSADQGHCYFWGAEMGAAGTRANDALNALYAFTGSSPLLRLPRAETGGFEGYLFSVAGDRKRVLVVFPQKSWIGGGVTFSMEKMSASGWSGSLQARLLHYKPDGIQTMPAEIVGNAREGYQIKPIKPVAMSEESTLLFMIERSN
jgi:hypothetical protein